MSLHFDISFTKKNSTHSLSFFLNFYRRGFYSLPSSETIHVQPVYIYIANISLKKYTINTSFCSCHSENHNENIKRVPWLTRPRVTVWRKAFVLLWRYRINNVSVSCGRRIEEGEGGSSRFEDFFMYNYIHAHFI